MYRLKPRREHVRHPDRSTVQYVHTILELTRIDYTVVSQSQTNRQTDRLTDTWQSGARLRGMNNGRRSSRLRDIVIYTDKVIILQLRAIDSVYLDYTVYTQCYAEPRYRLGTEP